MQNFERFHKTQANGFAVGKSQLGPRKLFRHPRTGIAHRALLKTEDSHDIAQLPAIQSYVRTQLSEEPFERLTGVSLDQVLEHLDRRDRAGIVVL